MEPQLKLSPPHGPMTAIRALAQAKAHIPHLAMVLATVIASECFLSDLQSVVNHLQDPRLIKTIALDPANINPAPLNENRSTWQPLSLSSGYPGILLLLSQLPSCEEATNTYVLAIKEAIETDGIADLSLFGGAAGICFALQQASCGGTRYQRMIDRLHAFLLDRVEHRYLAPLKKTRSDGICSSPRFYDPIQGIVGVARYALENLHLPSFESFVKKALGALVGLCQPLHYKQSILPGWYVSPNDEINSRHRDQYPKGNFNLGLAHGIPGVLAFLAIALLRGIEVDGQKETIALVAAWIRKKAFLKATICWPYSVSWEEEVDGQIAAKTTAKDAWCYGAPGIARSLFLAGKALQDRELKSFAISAFKDIFARTRDDWQLPGPTLCHGISGLLLITRKMVKEEGCEDLEPQLQKLQEILFSYYQPEFIWGFKDIETCRHGKCEVSKAGFLEGSAGILLTLLVDSEQSNWHLPLMIHA